MVGRICAGQCLGDPPNGADGQDECHAATSSVFCNSAENEIGTCQGVADRVLEF